MDGGDVGEARDVMGNTVAFLLTYARTYVVTVSTRNLSWVAPRHLAESLFWDLDYVHVPLPLQLSHAAC